MSLLFWDASALAKRYFNETGSATVNAIFASRTAHIMASTSWGYVETYSILQRRFNDGTLQAATFHTAASAIHNEVLALDFNLMPTHDRTVLSSIPIIAKHNLNATDAVLLNMLLEYSMTPAALVCVVISSDRRLLRAAEAEGLRILNPETVAPADVPAFLATL